MQKSQHYIFFCSIFLFSLLPLASADIIVNGPEQSSINFGDELSLGGYVIHDEALIGLLRFKLNCPTHQSMLLIRSVSLQASVQREYSETFPVIQGEEGNCMIDVELLEGTTLIETSSSGSFVLTSSLTASYALNKETLQAGEPLRISGMVLGQDGHAVNGYVLLSFEKDGITYFADSFPVSEGEVSYTIQTADIPSGNYNVKAEARDYFGNSLMKSVGSLLLTNQVTLTAHPNKGRYLPKEKVRISGTAEILSGKLKKGTVHIKLANRSFSEEVRNGNFDLDFYLRNTVESGKHEVSVSVEDTSGNVGTYAFSLIVDPIPTDINIVTNQEGVNPGESMTVKAFLEDQAGDTIEDQDLSFSVENEDGDVLYEIVKPSGEQFDVTIGEHVTPGAYVIYAKYKNIEGEKRFAIGKVRHISFSVEGQELVVANTGNVLYEGPLQVQLSSLEHDSKISKELRLAVGEEERIDLGLGIPSGLYLVQANEHSFEEIRIEGVAKANYAWLWWLFALFLAILAFSLFFLGGRKKRFHSKLHHSLSGGLKRMKKRGEYGGAPMGRVHNDEEHSRKFKDYMGRAASFARKPFRMKGLGARKGSDIFSNIDLKKKETSQEPITDVFSGVDSGWKRDNTETNSKEKKKDENSGEGNWFNMFG